ncbi:MAG: hypothetical protein JWR87_423 [Segetibacter sp.]|nr:hypothetical protein [Segetibacter sp.]MCW3078993.1 hypothetical protein [Segetibacter sp.]
MHLHNKLRERQFLLQQLLRKGVAEIIKKIQYSFRTLQEVLLYEVETLLNIAVMVEIVQEEKFRAFESMVDEEIRILNGNKNRMN